MTTHGQLAGLATRHEVTLLTQAGSDASDEEALELWRGRGVAVHPIWSPRPRGLRLQRRRLELAAGWASTRIPWRNILSRDPDVQRALDRLLAAGRYDAVLVEDNAMGLYGYRTAAPVVLTEHEVRRPRPVDWRRSFQRSSPRLLLEEWDWHRWRHYQRSVWRRFQRIQVFTPEDARAAGRLAPDLADRFRVNPFGIELPEPADARRELAGTLCFVGGFMHRPNVDAAVWLGRELMPRLRMRANGVRLTIVGGMPPADVQALAAEDVEVTGWVPDVDPYVRAAAVVLAPVRIGGGMRVKVLHAMAMGKAVVTTTRGTSGLDLGGGAAPVAVADRPDDFAETTAALVADDRARHALGERARAFASEHHSADAYALRSERILAEVLGERGGS